MNAITADELITLLNLTPHPEGGYFREMFRDEETCDHNGRAASTAIYFLLKEGQVSRWHTVDAVEIWHYYHGAPMQLSTAPPEGPITKAVLGNDFSSQARPQLVVPKGHWQQATPLGDFSLVGCTVAPAFEFTGFTLAPKGFEPGH